MPPDDDDDFDDLPEMEATQAPASESLEADLSTYCPVDAERLAPRDRRYVDAKGPVAGRMMAAKAIVPLQPTDMVHVLFMLTYDPDEKVKETARKSASELGEKILGAALRDEEMHPLVLDFYAEALHTKDNYLQLITLNNSTGDETLARIAVDCGPTLAETISQNQLRLLRTPLILRNLCGNPNTSKATVDLACDFAIRSGLFMDDVPQMKEARLRINGPDTEDGPPELEDTAEKLLEEEVATLAEADAPPLDEGRRMNLTQRIVKMTVAEKIKLATLGNKEARSMLVRDANRLVVMAAIRSPRITDGEIWIMANSRTAPDDVLRYIYSTREWTKQYKVKLSLVKNPKVPVPIALKFLSTLRESEIVGLAKDKNVPGAVQQQARKMIDKKKGGK